MAEELTQADLEAYLDEALDAEQASLLEQKLRENPKLVQQLSAINARHNAGIHTLGEIWRRFQIGVPTREQLGSYLMGTLEEGDADYVRFRIEILKCPYTIANFKDLQQQREQSGAEIDVRRERLFRLSERISKDHD